MPNMRCITPKEMRDINRTCILEYLRQRGAASRTAIADDLGLSLSSVVRITDELMEDRFVHLEGKYEFSGGRRRPLIELDALHNVVVSISLGSTDATASLYDILGNMLEVRTIYNHDKKGEAYLPLIRELADDMIASNNHQIIRGISISVPGIVEHGNLVTSPSIGMIDYYLADMLQPYFEYPVFIENNVNLAALGELWFGYGKQCDDLLYIHIGTLIGMGIILGRCILRGAHQGAGELGSLVLDAKQMKSQFHRIGALEETISGYGLKKRAHQMLSDSKDKPIHDTTTELFKAAEEGAKWANEITGDFVQKLSMVIVDVATLFDPEVIILGGGVMQSGQRYLPQIRELIQRKTPNPIRLEKTKLGKHAHLLGGCTSVIQNVMNYTMFKRNI